MMILQQTLSVLGFIVAVRTTSAFVPSSEAAAAAAGKKKFERKALQTTLEVDLGERSYPIYIGSKLLETEVWTRHVKGTSVAVITNEVVAPLYLEKAVKMLEATQEKRVETLVLPDGEGTKSLANLELIMDFALEKKLDRTSCFVALGGGVIGDLVGFAAAIYQRGVDFVQIPTTLMAMVDSSVGGKTAVNHPKGKNMIGAFYQPQCVLIDVDSLDSLPAREYASGVAEIIKYGLIGDAPFFEWQEKNVDALMDRDPAIVGEAIKLSCENKAHVVKLDEKEAGVRATLNLGHTFGHAIEAHAGYGTYLHGEAVAIGIAMAAAMSRKLGWIDAHLEQRTLKLLRRAHLPVSLPPSFTDSKADLLDLMNLDKKVQAGNLRLILLKGPLGHCVFTKDFDDSALHATIDDFTSFPPIGDVSKVTK